MSQPASTMERVIAGVTMFIAFLVMASIFVPDPSHAWQVAVPGVDGQPSEYFSTDPHEGLPMLGSVEQVRYAVEIYGTELGPRYSVYDTETGESLGVLMTDEQVGMRFPDLPVADFDFSGPSVLMLAEPIDGGW